MEEEDIQAGGMSLIPLREEAECDWTLNLLNDGVSTGFETVTKMEDGGFHLWAGGRVVAYVGDERGSVPSEIMDKLDEICVGVSPDDTGRANVDGSTTDEIYKGQAWQKEQMLDYLNRSYVFEEEMTRVQGSTIWVYTNDSSNFHVKKHDTEYFSTGIPWVLSRLVVDGLIDIKTVQFTMYPDGNGKGDRKYNCFFQLSINWDNFTEEQDRTYWRANVHYP